MVYNEIQYKALNGSKKIRFSEEYVVTFTMQGDDGYWKKQHISYRSDSKSDHYKVEELFKSDYPTADVISVIYQ